MPRIFLVAAAALALSATAARAQTSPVTPECILQAAQLQQIPVQIILGLLKTEGGRLGTESRNRNGSIDLGPMQVNNRVWVPVLARMHFGGNQDAAYRMLRDNGCYSIHVGAWIYRTNLDDVNGDYAEAVGRYNSRNEAPKRAYQRRFAEAFSSLFPSTQGVR